MKIALAVIRLAMVSVAVGIAVLVGAATGWPLKSLAVERLDVANTVHPLIGKIVHDTCDRASGWNADGSQTAAWSYNAALIWKDIPSDMERDHRGCIGGVNHQFFARCYEVAWATGIDKIGQPFPVTASWEDDLHLFYKPVKDIDLGVYMCVEPDPWPYWDEKLQNAPLGKIYQVN